MGLLAGLHAREDRALRRLRADHSFGDWWSEECEEGSGGRLIFRLVEMLGMGRGGVTLRLAGQLFFDDGQRFFHEVIAIGPIVGVAEVQMAVAREQAQEV